MSREEGRGAIPVDAGSDVRARGRVGVLRLGLARSVVAAAARPHTRAARVRPSAGTTGKWQVSTTGGTYPRWRRDGKEIFFMNNDRKLMAVGVKSGSSTFEAGVPQLLFEMRLMRDAVAMISGSKPLTTPEEFKKFYQNSGIRRRRAAASATSTRPSSSSACPTGPLAAHRTWWASRRRRKAAARSFSCSGSTKTSS
jgi:hypothetical protein